MARFPTLRAGLLLTALLGALWHGSSAQAAEPSLSADAAYVFTGQQLNRLDVSEAAGESPAFSHGIQLNVRTGLPLNRWSFALDSRLNLGLDDALQSAPTTGDNGVLPAFRFQPELALQVSYKAAEVLQLTLFDRLQGMRILNVDREAIYASATSPSSVLETPPADPTDTGFDSSLLSPELFTLLSLPQDGWANEVGVGLSAGQGLRVLPEGAARYRLYRPTACTPAEVLPLLGIQSGGYDYNNDSVDLRAQLRYGLDGVRWLSLAAQARLEQNEARAECLEQAASPARFALLNPTLGLNFRGETLELNAQAGAALIWQLPTPESGLSPDFKGRPLLSLGLEQRFAWGQVASRLGTSVETGLGQPEPTYNLLASVAASYQRVQWWRASSGAAFLRALQLFDGSEDLVRPAQGWTLALRSELMFQPRYWLEASGGYALSHQVRLLPGEPSSDGTEQDTRDRVRIHTLFVKVTGRFGAWSTGDK